jgi:thermitase
MGVSTTTPRTGLVLAVLAILLGLPVPARAEAAATAADLEAAGVRDIIVKRRPGLDRSQRAALRAGADVRLRRALTLADTELVRAEAGRLTEALAALDADPDVVYAEPNAPVRALTADPYWPLQWGLENTAQPIEGTSGRQDADIDAPEAWALGVTGAAQTVAVVDSGVDATHPGLTGRMAISPRESGGGRESNGIDDDRNGLIDDWRGWDWVQGDNDPADVEGHGTHVAGIVAAPRDAVGIAGVAPDARVMALRVLDATGTGTVADVAEAYRYAGALGVRVVNASIGGDAESITQRSAIAAYPDTLFVVAAGNGGDDGAADDNDATPIFPCAFDLANLICVGATDNHDEPAAFSNVGARSVDLFAPGVSIVSTYLGGAYAFMDGTSMATPHAAGTLALMRAAAPALDGAQLRQALLASVDPTDGLDGLSVTGGRLNAHAAVRAAVQAARLVDADNDGIRDGMDTCATTPDPAQADTDGDGVGDACDATPSGLPAAAPPIAASASSPPQTASAVAPPAPARIRPPRLLAVATPRGATVRLCAARRRGCTPRPLTVTFRLDRAATVTARVERRTCARGRCRYVAAATIRLGASAGAHRLIIGARGPTARLTAGRYRLRIAAAVGSTRSAPVLHAFRVARR